MPEDAPESLSDEEYRAIVAYIIRENGGVLGGVSLDGAPAVGTAQSQPADAPSAAEAALTSARAGSEAAPRPGGPRAVRRRAAGRGPARQLRRPETPPRPGKTSPRPPASRPSPAAPGTAPSPHALDRPPPAGVGDVTETPTGVTRTYRPARPRARLRRRSGRPPPRPTGCTGAAARVRGGTARSTRSACRTSTACSSTWSLGHGGRAQPAGASGARRSSLPQQSRQRGAGAGRGRWHPPVGISPAFRRGRPAWPAAHPGPLGGHGVRGHRRRPHGCARRRHRNRPLGDPHRRPGEGLLKQHGPHRRRWQGHQRHQRVRPLLRGELLHHRPRRPHRPRTLAHPHRGPPRRAWWRHLGRPALRAARGEPMSG